MISDKPTLTIPHRDPFVFVSRLIERNADGSHGIVEYDVDPKLDCFRGHFPGFPVFPGVLQMESIGQACIWIRFGVLSPSDPQPAVLFAGVNEFRFKKPVLPGVVLRHDLKLVKVKSGIYLWESQSTVDNVLTCKGAFYISIRDNK
jgi:3-hydroxyacyl-[acyl-carrier-protein] dehydratase